jgi:hypothetical protein
MALLLIFLLFGLVASAGAGEWTPATALFVLGDSTASCAATTLPLNLTLSSTFSSRCLFHSGSRRLLPDLLGKRPAAL